MWLFMTERLRELGLRVGGRVVLIMPHCSRLRIWYALSLALRSYEKNTTADAIFVVRPSNRPLLCIPSKLFPGFIISCAPWNDLLCTLPPPQSHRLLKSIPPLLLPAPRLLQPHLFRNPDRMVSSMGRDVAYSGERTCPSMGHVQM